jgi:hypothetical protein
VEDWFAFSGYVRAWDSEPLGGDFEYYYILGLFAKENGDDCAGQVITIVDYCHFGSRREWFSVGIHPPSKNQRTDVSIVDDVGGVMRRDASGGIQAICRGNIHSRGPWIQKNHGVCLITAANGEADAGLDVKIASGYARVGNTTIVANAVPFK